MLLKFFKHSPFSRLFFFYAAGLIVSNHFTVSGWLVISLSAIAVFMALSVVLAMKAFRHPDLNWIFGFTLSCVLFIIGLIHNELEKNSRSKAEDLISRESVFLARIQELPEIKSKSIQVRVRIMGELENNKLKKNTLKAILYFEKDPASENLKPGYLVGIRTRFEKVPASGNPGEFNYRKYLANRKVYLQSFIAAESWCLTTEKPSKGIRIIAENFRRRLLDRYRKLDMDQREFNVLSALTLGYRRDLDTETKNAFAKAGVMHVMALSGFHTGVIALLLGYLFGMFNGSPTGRAIRIIMILMMLWGFAMITGLSASVTRATVMLSLVMAGKFFGRKINTYNILFAAAFFILAVTPGLIADVSFQLSFLAVGGIVLFHPVFYRIVRIKNRLADMIWQLFTVSCAAQLGTLPLTMYYFHQFPLFFWLANLYTLPLVAVVIYLAAAYLLLSFIAPLSRITGQMLLWTVKCLLHGVSLVEAFPNALIDGIYISAAQTVLLLVAVSCFGLFLSYRIKIPLFAGLLILPVVLLLGIKHDCELNRQKRFTINNLNGISSINLISGHRNLLLANPDSLITPAKIMYSFNDYWIERGVHDRVKILDFNDPGLTDSLDFPGLYIRQNFLRDQVYLNFYETSVVIMKNDAYRQVITDSMLEVDLVVVTGNVYPDMGKITQLFDPERLVIDSSVKFYNAEKWKNACAEYGVDCWNIAAQGAYTVKPGMSN
ncbi:MAG: ComEC/Rec2 family competence protein [Bacteroidales bacterium]|nr:ComEC/Rec2 family competence protein [Bacteroidales bacterium]